MAVPTAADYRRERLTRLRDVYVDEFGCWLYRGRVGQEGYPLIGQNAIRLAYQEFVGPIPKGMHIDHTCHKPQTCVCGPRCLHRRCLNPAHLEPVEPIENWLRGKLGQRYLGRLTA